MNNNPKVIWILVGLIIVVVIIGLVLKGKGQQPTDTSGTQGDQSSVTQEPQSTEDQSAGSVNASNTASLTYENAVAKYMDRRIQFGPDCIARPNIVTYKDNTGIMLDNRSNQSRTFTFGTTPYTIKAWGFKIVTLPDTYKTAKTIYVDCGKQLNAATIIIQE